MAEGGTTLMRSSRFVATLILPALLLCTAGCEQPVTPVGGRSTPPASPKPGDGPVESNIIRVNKFLSADPWLCFNSDGSGRIDGFRITVYLEGAGKPKGVFGTGTIIVEMYRIDRDQRGRESAHPVHKWELPADQAYPWRAKEASGMGWGYGLRLQWSSDLDLAGRTVAFVVKYVREDGVVISSSRQVVKVPPSRDLVPLG
jgi:hypothetical protein